MRKDSISNTLHPVTKRDQDALRLSPHRTNHGATRCHRISCTYGSSVRPMRVRDTRGAIHTYYMST